MKRFRLGIVGAGQITAARHLPAALASPMLEVAALVDADRNRAERLASDFHLGAIAADSMDEVLDRVDGVVIATPNHTHRNVALSALSAGKPVLIEKPIANRTEEGRMIVEAGEAAGALVAVGYATRFDPRMTLLKDLFDSGYFGRTSRFVYRLGMADWGAPMSGYTFRADAAGGGVLIVNGSHFIDRMLWWFGKPTNFNYEDDSAGGPECRCELRVTYAHDSEEMAGYIWITKDMRLANGFVADTDAGFLIVPEDAGAPIVLRPKDRPSMQLSIRTDAAQPVPDVFRLQMENFAKAARGDEPLLVDGREGLRSLEFIEAAYARRTPLEIEGAPSRAAVRGGL